MNDGNARTDRSGEKRTNVFLAMLFSLTLLTQSCTTADPYPIGGKSPSVEPLLETHEAAPLSVEESLVVKTVILWFVQRELRADRRSVLFLQVFGKNPDSRFLSILNAEMSERVRAKPASEGMLTGDRVHDPGAQWAQLLSVNRIKITDQTAAVEVSTSVDLRSGAIYEYHLLRRDRSWTVISSKVLIRS